MITAIVRIKPPYDQGPVEALRLLAQYSLDTFGEGGDPDAQQIEGFVGWVNTPVFNGYVRMRIGLAYGMALEYIESIGGSPLAELIRVEWQGQDIVEILTDNYEAVLEDGSTIIVTDLEDFPDAVPTGTQSLMYVEQLFQTGTQDITDEEGNVIGTQPVYLGRF